MQEGENNPQLESRRKFLATCGKFAVVTPPVITMMLSTSSQSFASAVSGGSPARGSNGRGKGKGKGKGWAGFFSWLF